MAFIRESVEHWIRMNIETTEERNDKFRKHLQPTKAKCDKLKHQWAQPVKQYEPWNSYKATKGF